MRDRVPTAIRLTEEDTEIVRKLEGLTGLEGLTAVFRLSIRETLAAWERKQPKRPRQAMMSEETIRERVRAQIEGARGTGSTSAATVLFSGDCLDVDPLPFLFVVEGNDVWPRSALPTLACPLPAHREFTRDEFTRIRPEWDAAVRGVMALKRRDVAIVLHAATARVDLRVGPDYSVSERQ